MLFGSGLVFLSTLWMSCLALLCFSFILLHKKSFWMLFVVFFAGWVGFSGAMNAVNSFLPPGEIEISGTLEAVGLLEYNQYYLQGEYQGRSIKLLIQENRGQTILSDYKKSLAGRGVRINGEVTAVLGSTNPKGFSYKNHLIGKGCQGTVQLKTLTFEPGLDSVTEQLRVSLGRQWLASVYKATAWQQGDLAIGILLGEDQRIDEAVKSDYQITGTTHILTVSGVHFGILILCVNHLLSRLEMPYLRRKLILLTLVTFMLWIIGWDTAAFRAFWMLLLLELAMMLFAQPDALHALSWTAILLSLQTPGILPNVSFQLSLSALIGLIVVFPFIYPRQRITAWITRAEGGGTASTEFENKTIGIRSLLFIEKHLIAPFFASFSVMVTMAPLLIYSFNSLSVSSLFYNIPVAWLSAWTLPLLAIIGPLSLWPPVALAAGIPAGVLLKIMSLCVATAKTWNWLPINLPSLSLGLVCISCTSLGLVLACKQNAFVAQFKRMTILFFLIFISFVCLNLARTDVQSPFAEVFYFDVGQGDGALFKMQNGKTLLIDTGKLMKRGGIEELLLKAGVSRIDTLIITHFHEDHVGQYEQLFQRITIGQIGMFTKGYNGQSATCQAFIKAAKVRHIKQTELHAGMILNGYQVVWPPQGYSSTDLNDESLVGIVTVGKINFLMTGDMTSKVEYDIMKRVSKGTEQIKPHKKWVLKVPHHGSRRSNSRVVTSLEGLESAVVSVGVNFYKHPSKSVVEQYEHRLGDDFFRTDRQGYVHYMTDGFKLYVNQKGGRHGISGID